MAKFTRVAIRGAAKELLAFDTGGELKWDDLSDADKLDYMRDAEKILESAAAELTGKRSERNGIGK